MSIAAGTKINRLLASTDPSGLLFCSWLKANGYSEQLQQRYRDHGWLESLSRGVMIRAGSKLDAYSALASCNFQTGAKHRIAAHSAIEYSGFNHYVPMGKPVLRVALDSPGKTPSWMKNELFDMTFRTFHTDAFAWIDAIKSDMTAGTLYISSPELAFMECLLLAPKYYDYMDLYYIMEQLGTLRSDVVQRLLETTKNFRVKRMFLYMAEKAGHDWLKRVSLENVSLGSSKLQLAQGGTYEAKYMMTVPKELHDYE